MQLAQLLQGRSRRGDVVCRVAGDEIALLLPGCSASAAHQRAEAIMDDVQASSFLIGDGEVVHVAVSVGAAHSPTDADSLRTLYAAADAALYEGKRAGRNRVTAALDHT